MIRVLLALVAAAVAAGVAASAPTSQRPRASAVTAGIAHSCAVTVGGKVRCWGYNGHDELGDGRGDSQNSSVPVAVQGLSGGVTAVAAGLRHTCAVRNGGALCWGVNYSGALGDGTDWRHAAPVGVVGLSSGVTAVAAGAEHSCALTTAGAVKCWGDNHVGEVGDGTTDDRWTPVDVVGLNGGVRAIAAESVHSCALTDAGAVKCWGATYGPSPIDVPGLTSDVIGLAANCALTTSHGVKCWTGGPGLHAYSIPGLEGGVASVATAGGHSCALTVRGGVLCWGENDFGQVGDGTTHDRVKPVVVLTRGVIAIGLGFFFSCAVTLAGGVRCWGDNSAGQLGDGTEKQRHRPVSVIGYGLRASVTMGSRRIHVGGRGLALVGLRCGVPVACRGTLVLERRGTVIGRHGFTIVGGHRALVPVRLTARALALLQRAGRLQAVGRARFRQPDDVSTTVVQSLTLVARG